MSSSRRGQASRSRPTTKARQEQSASTAPVPAPVKQERRNPRKPHGKKHAASMPPRSHDTPRRPRTKCQADDFCYMGGWCGDVPERHYAPRIGVSADHHARCPPAAPTPPSVTPPRTDSPRPSLLAFDTEFSEAQLDKDEPVGDVWYLARRAKTNRQLEEALAHIARTRLLPEAD